VILFTSAFPKEGKSTTLGNLAVAMALAGKSVALVDLDLRRPAVAEFFRLEGELQGLTAVVLGHASLDEALVQVPLEPLSRNAAEQQFNGSNGAAASTNGAGAKSAATGSLALLPTGILPPDPGEFVGLEGVGRAISALRERADFVLLDVPPLLAVGDALTIAGSADAVVAVVRSELAKRSPTGELGAIFARMPAHGLGYVLCGVAGAGEDTHYGYGYGYGYGRGHYDPVPSRREGSEV